MIIQQQILPQLQKNTEQFLHCGLQKNIDWQQMTDQQLQQYENQLLSLYQELDPQQQISSDEFHLNESENNQPIHSLRFKELFFDSLEGNSHQILSLGFIQNQHEYQKLENEILKQTVMILFQISQKEKTFYPHLFTHIKQQFYKPNILSDLSLSEKQQSQYFQLINDFFNQTGQVLQYEQFIIKNPQFQQICVFILGKIAGEDKRLLQINDCYHQSTISQTKAFNFIEKICKKFLIETSFFGYQNPSIQMIAIGNEERFIFVNDSNHIFAIKLQKLQLLNVRRKSSHNISVMNNQQNNNQSKNQKDKKKIKAKESYRIAYFGGQKTPENFQFQKSSFNMADEDDTSNFDSSFMKSESKANQLSDQSTPKFKNSSIAHARKKSHKDSFGGVDFDNLVYKDLSNPKRHTLQKTRFKDLEINTSHQKSNKKVFSQRFETNQIGSLTCGQDEDSEIEFLPHFQMQGTNQDETSLSLFGNSPNSPGYSYQNHHANFSSFHLDAQFQNPKNILTKKMKTSNIETSSKFFNYEDQQKYEQLNFWQQGNYHKQRLTPNRQNFIGNNRVLATSEIIQFSGAQQQNNYSQTKFIQMEQTEDFLIIPAMNSKNQIKNQGFQGKSLKSIPHKEVFMSFSKNDKQKFLIPDFFDSQQNLLSKKKSQQSKNYVYRTAKQERQQYRFKLKLQNQSSLSHKSFKTPKTKDQSVMKPNKCHSSYQKYQNNSQKSIKVHYENTEEIYNKQSKSDIFNQNLSQNLRLQRKHSSNIPVYQAVQSPQQGGQIRKSPELNFVNTRQQISKRFQQNSVRFSQIIDNQDDQIFYIKTKEDKKQGFGTKKQRKVTDFYQGPLVNIKKNENKSSQVIQNSRERQLKQKNNNFQSHLSINQDKSNILINSGGGKNYSVLSNVSYDEQKRLEDLLEMENHLNNKNYQTLTSKVNQNQLPSNYFESELDFANFQAIQRLIFKKKQQRNKLQTDLINISISNQHNHSKIQEPQNWLKKEIFYFFEPVSSVTLPPVKKVILNPKQQKQTSKTFLNNNKTINFNNKSYNHHHHPHHHLNNNNTKKNTINSSTSLYNFSPLNKNQQQQSKQFKQRQSYVENRNTFERKYSTQQIRPLIEFRNQDGMMNGQRYFNEQYESCSNFGQSKSSSFVGQMKHSPFVIRPVTGQNYYMSQNQNQNYDRLSVNTLQPSLKNNVFYQPTKSVINNKQQQQQIPINQTRREYTQKQVVPKIKFIWNNQTIHSSCKSIPSMSSSISRN